MPLTCITTVRAGVAKINQSGRVEGPVPTYGSLAILVRAGLQVTAVWPIRTEPRNIVRLAGADDDPAPAIVTALGPNVKRSSWGLSAQVGADIEIGKGTYLNIDLKKVQIDTDVSSKGNKVGTFKVDPLLLGVGVGWRF